MSRDQKKQERPGGTWLSTSVFRELATLSPRGAKWVLAKAHSGRTWRAERLTIRLVQGIGGASGRRYEVLLSSLPEPLQMKWHAQQPKADLREAVAEYRELIEEERRRGIRKNRLRFNNLPWTQEEREMRHAAFSRMATSMQHEARRRFEIVHFFHSFDGSDIPVRERYAIAARKAEASISTVRNWVGACNNLHRGDWLAALAPQYRGWRIDVKISPAAYEWIKAEYFTLSKPSLKPIYYRAERMASAQSWTLPSYDTVKRLIQGEPHDLHVLMREGQDAAAQLYPAQERDYSTLKLHELWCSDGRMSDVFVRWDDGSVSRPIVVAWIDVRSRVCLGHAIGKTESADLIRIAFKAAAEHARALPEAALMDNGRAFASKLLTGGAPNRYRFKVKEEDVPGILVLLGIEITWARPYNGRAKPIESWWRTIAEMDKRFPGAYCGNKPDARPEDCDPAKAVPIAKYRAMFEQTVAEYHMKPHRGDAMDDRSPHDIYAQLLPQTAVRQPSREQLRLCMLAAKVIRLDPSDGCVRLLGNRYWTKELAALPRNIDYVVRYDPEDASQAVALCRGEEFLYDVPLIERTGFRDQQAAKDSARGNRRFLKALKERAAAIKDMSKAAAWMAAPGAESESVREAAAAALPAPKIVRPTRPEKDYSPKTKEPNAIPRDQVRRIFTETYRPKVKTA